MQHCYIVSLHYVYIIITLLLINTTFNVRLLRSIDYLNNYYMCPKWTELCCEKSKFYACSFLGHICSFRKNKSTVKFTVPRFLHPEDPTASDLALKADEALFRAVCTNPNHVLSSLLPRLKQHQYNLRSRVHNFSLPPKDDRNFASRSLYRNIY